MRQYLDLLQEVAEFGEWSGNRTGVRTKGLFGKMIQHDLSDGFPLLTTKKMAWNQIKGELLSFIAGDTDVRKFRERGCTIWDANLDAEWWKAKRESEYDLGLIYGFQWRSFNGVDQLKELVETIKKDPSSRRLIVSAWNPNQIEFMCLPPCHVMFQVRITGDYLNLAWYQRSCDLFLGVPFNIASYALLTHILAEMTGYLPGTVTGFLGDVHIYENHLDQVDMQLSRNELNLPSLHLSDITTLDRLDNATIDLVNYECHPAIKAEMAV